MHLSIVALTDIGPAEQLADTPPFQAATLVLYRPETTR